MEQNKETFLEEPQFEDNSTLACELIYGLEDRPPIVESLLVALQHVLAVFVAIITPPLIICNALEIDAVDTNFIVSMSLFVSGIATFIQARRFGSIGSGLLTIQGTSFAFLGPILSTGLVALEAGKTQNEVLGLIFGLCFFGAFVEIFLSRFLHLAQKVISPLVTGIVVTLIGLTLIKVGITSMGGGVSAQNDGTFGSLQNYGLEIPGVSRGSLS